MTLRRMIWVLIVLGLPVIVLFTWTTLAVGQQVKKIDDKALKTAGKGTEWLSNGMGWSEQRYSTLAQINPANVGKLALAWSYELGPGGGSQQATPLYSNGVLYTVTNWSIVAAVDAKTGKEIWRYDPDADRTMTQPGKSRLCCGVNSRGIALYEGKVLVPVVDGRMQALDGATGKLLWSSWAIPEPKEGEISPYSLTMAARVAKGKVFIGNAGAEFPPFRGYVSAFDVNTGKELWKFYTTPGDPSKGFDNKAMEAAAKTWAGEWWKMGGGGSMWDGMAYDPDTNLLYIGTGNGTVWSADIRNGGRQEPHPDNLYIASILAIDADTGQLKGHYQCTPGDEWDYDAIQHLLLADIRIDNRNRKVVMQANKNGYFYVIDRIGYRRIHLRVRDVAGELGHGNRSENRPSRHSSRCALFLDEGRDGISGADAQHVADVVQSEHGSDLCSDRRRKHIQLRRGGDLHANSREPELRTESGRGTGRRHTDGIPASSRTGAQESRWKQSAWRHSQRVGSRHSKGTVVRTGRRAVGRRHAYRWHRTSYFKRWVTDT